MQEDQWKKIAKIKEELVKKGWRDDTLSPLSEEPYWKLCYQLVKDDEKVHSILFAKSVPAALLQKKYVFIVTEHNLIYRSDYGGYITSPKVIALKDLGKVKISEDKYLPSFLYIDFNFGLFKELHLQTFDLTGVLHFEAAISSKKEQK